MSLLNPSRKKKTPSSDLTEEQKLCRSFGVPVKYASYRGVITRLRGFDAHRRACIQGYRAKGLLVKDGKGHNTLAGIPSVWTT